MKKAYFLSDAHLGARYITNKREHEGRLVAFLDSIKDDAAELHKLGYEKFRVCAYISPNGAGYRCALTVKQNCWKKNGLFCNPFDNEFSIETPNCKLPWDFIALTPQENALRIIQEYPYLAHYALGRDSKYVEWFKLALDECRKEHYFYAFSEWNNALRDGYTPLSGVYGTGLPLPPVGDCETQTMY